MVGLGEVVVVSVRVWVQLLILLRPTVNEVSWFPVAVLRWWFRVNVLLANLLREKD